MVKTHGIPWVSGRCSSWLDGFFGDHPSGRPCQIYAFRKPNVSWVAKTLIGYGIITVIIMGYIKKSYGIIIYYNPKNLGFQDFGTLGLKYWGFNWRFATSTKMLQPFTHDATFRSFSAVAQPISWARHDRYRNPCQLPVSNLSAIEPTPMAQLPAVRFFPLWKSAV